MNQFKSILIYLKLYFQIEIYISNRYKKEQNMKVWFNNEDLTNGKYEHLFPIFTKQTLQTLRSKKKISYSKSGREVVYKKEWIEEYLEANTRDVVA